MAVRQFLTVRILFFYFSKPIKGKVKGTIRTDTLASITLVKVDYFLKLSGV